VNYLQLCQALAEDSGTVAGVPNFTTVVGASGRIKQVVGWVRDAYIDIQNERTDWRWMRRSFEEALTIDQIVYAQDDLNLDDVAFWLPDLPGIGWRNLSIYETGYPERESEIGQIDYPLFRQRYQRGVHDANRPIEWAISPLGELMFGPKPDKAYIVKGEYFMKPETLTADEDIPSMPDQYHRVIVQEAMRLMARSDEAFEVIGEKGQQYDRLRNALVRDQTPDLQFGGGTFA